MQAKLQQPAALLLADCTQVRAILQKMAKPLTSDGTDERLLVGYLKRLQTSAKALEKALGDPKPA